MDSIVVGNPEAMSALNRGREVEFGSMRLGLRGETALLRVGSLSARAVGDLRKALNAVQERGAPRLVVDMRECTFVCSRAIGEFITLVKNERASAVWSCSVVLFGTPEGVEYSLKTAGLLNFLMIEHDSMESALAA